MFPIIIPIPIFTAPFNEKKKYKIKKKIRKENKDEKIKIEDSTFLFEREMMKRQNYTENKIDYIYGILK